jgi:hypothetical protein
VETEESRPDLWSLTSDELASQIGLVSHAVPAAFDVKTRNEASLLMAEWQRVQNLPKPTFEEQENRVAQLDALQKRTIQLLIRTRQFSPAPPLSE